MKSKRLTTVQKLAEQFPARFARPGLTSARTQFIRGVRELLAEVLSELGRPESAVSMLFCSESAMRDLNKLYLGMDAPTDVLSFPAEDPAGEVPPDALLGDLAICLPYAARNASKEKRTVSGEAALLLVHGVLHLLGHDHDTAPRKKVMWDETKRLLKLPAAKAFVALDVTIS
jgi:rRNA maturation RNase YbeY